MMVGFVNGSASARRETPAAGSTPNIQRPTPNSESKQRFAFGCHTIHTVGLHEWRRQRMRDFQFRARERSEAVGKVTQPVPAVLRRPHSRDGLCHICSAPSRRLCPSCHARLKISPTLLPRHVPATEPCSSYQHFVIRHSALEPWALKYLPLLMRLPWERSAFTSATRAHSMTPSP